MQSRWRFVKNALANLGRGSAAAVVSVLLPPILVRHMPAASYAVWILVLQTAAYVSYLNFGLQTAIGRYVAYANARGDVAQRDSVFSTAFAGLCGAALLALLGLAVVTAAAPAIFPSVPPLLVLPMRLALLIVGFSMAMELPASACNGVFIGVERYEVPALTIGGARLVSAIGVVAAALAGRSLIFMATVVAAANLASYAAQFLALRNLAPEIRFHPALVSRSTARELYGYCFGLTVMSISTLLVSGLDLAIVGHFDFAAVIPYSVAASMILLIAGLLYAVVNVILPHAAVLHAREQAAEMGQLVISTTRISVLLLVLSGLPILIYARPILHLWIGQRFVSTGAPILAVLIVANIIRLIGAPYAVILVAGGQQNYIKISPLSEGISNFIASLALGALFGGIGVAMGTLVGSFVSIGSHLFYSMPRTRAAIALSRRELIVSGVLEPLLWTLPLVAVATAVTLFNTPVPLTAFILLFALSACGALVCLRRSGMMSLRHPRATAE